jgi:microcompartment protein CcmK/EutM
MFVGEVVGNAWGQCKHPSLDGKKLLLVRPIHPITGEPLGEALLAVEGGVGAGPGSVVLVVDEGNSARGILADQKAPVRTVICGILDRADMGGRSKRYG